MSAVLLLCAGLLGLSAPDQSEYQAAAARAGRDAGAQLKLAVWCEAHGMDAERLKHLASVLLRDPRNSAARGMMGLVDYAGRWMSPEMVGQAVNADEAMTAKLARYEAKRQITPDTADAQWKLALWCEQNGLKAEATAHFTAVTRLAPRRTEAWHKLGCRLHHGRWMNAEQIAAESAEKDAQQKADRHWQPIVEKWKKELVFDNPGFEQAVLALKEITDPRAVPTILRMLGHGNRAQQQTAIVLLSRIECPASSRTLAALAMFAPSREVRTFATQELTRRDPRDFMDAMIGALRRPIKFDFKPVGPSGEPGVLIVEDDRSRSQRVYEVPRVIATGPNGQGRVTADANGNAKFDFDPMALANPRWGQSPEQTRKTIEREVSTLVKNAQTQTKATLEQDLARLRAYNAEVGRANSPIESALKEITGESFGGDPDIWLKWWNDKLGLSYERAESTEKTTIVQYVPIEVPLAPLRLHHSCFAAGTPVSTLTGLRPIESLKMGDLVLSQDTVTGILSYQPILGVHHNRPAETLRIRLKDETLVSTPVHRFWRPGRGWAMARDLKPGDFIRTVGGRAEIVEIQPDRVQPVFNLDVARNNTFFVGAKRSLVRDNSLPPAMLTPFDAEPSLASIAESVPGL
jgi:hypothetical protein